MEDRWSRKHAHTQRRLCERFAEPVIGTVTTLLMYVGSTAGVLDRARQVTD